MGTGTGNRLDSNAHALHIALAIEGQLAVHSYLHHMGDWATHTSHLDWLEIAAYHKLIEAYYTTEQALPGELQAVFRVIGALTKTERAATRNVLEQFFTREADGKWHQKRCDEEIERQQRFSELQRDNANKRWNGRPEGETLPKSVHPLNKSFTNRVPESLPGAIVQTTPRPLATINGQTDDANGIATAMPTHMPTMNHELNTSLAAAASVGVACERACEAAAAGGIEVNPTDPRLAALVADGATPGEFRMAAARATAAGKGVAWFYAAVSGMRQDSAAGMPREGPKTGAGSPNYPMLPRWYDPH